MNPMTKGKGRLSPHAVKFAWHMLATGGENLLYYFAQDASSFSARNMALTLAYMARIAYTNRDHLCSHFRPLALHWELKAQEKKSVDMRFHGQYVANQLVGDAQMLDQFQPDLPATHISVLENMRPETGMQLLKWAYGHETEEDQIKRCGLGLAHAVEIAREVMIEQGYEYCFAARQSLPLFHTPLYRPLFILLDYTAFAKYEDKVGTRALAWMELCRIYEPRDSTSKQTVQIRFHSDLNILIPQDALVVLANIEWFEKSK